MRIAVLILAILGGLGAAALGVLWLLNCQKDRNAVELARLIAAEIPAGAPDSSKIIDELREYDRRVKAYPFLLVGFVLAVAGGFLAMQRRGKSAAVLLLLAALGPAILNPLSLIFTFLLPIAAVLSLFIRPARVPDAGLPSRSNLQLATE
jgi:hypothetical protein